MSWPEVVPVDVANLWRPLTAAEETVAAARIKVVEAELRRELRFYGIPGTPTFETSEEGDEWEELYRAMVADVVRDSLKNPDGWSEETERIDDYELTRRREKSAAAGLYYLHEADVAKLLPRIRRARGAFTIRLGQT